MSDTTFEKHYTVAELAEQWGVGVSTVRRRIKGEPGVLVLRGPGGKPTYRIPEPVARRIHLKYTIS
jgi:hypothetical protein